MGDEEDSDKSMNEYLKFDRVKNKLSTRPDLHALILLNSLLPGDDDIICGSEHDQYWLNVDCDELAKVITEEQVLDLIRCGISYDEYLNSLYSFV